MLLIFLALRQVALLLGLAEGHLPSRITYYSNYYTVVIELLSLKGHLSLPKMQHAHRILAVIPPTFPSRMGSTSKIEKSKKKSLQQGSTSKIENKNQCRATVRHRGMGTGISEASKGVPIFSWMMIG